MSSKSATVLVIFIVAVIAFCLASVFASMTGPISILPNESDSGGVLDNLSAITDDTTTYSDNSYGYQDYSSDDNSYSDSNVETTSDTSQSTDDSQVETTTDDAPSTNDNDGGQDNVETNVPDESLNVENQVSDE